MVAWLTESAWTVASVPSSSDCACRVKLAINARKIVIIVFIGCKITQKSRKIQKITQLFSFISIKILKFAAK